MNDISQACGAGGEAFACENQPEDAVGSVRVYAEVYADAGYSVIPIPYRSKNPGRKGWQGLRLKPEDIPAHFPGTHHQNIGVLLGEPSGELVDGDIDSPEALRLADRFLPPTATFGRRSKPRSHWIYRVNPHLETSQFQAVDGSMLVDLRSTGAQTVFPPSEHPSGEAIKWENYQVAEISADGLYRRVSRLATAALLLRNYPQEGSRQECALCLSGGLLRGGWPVPDTEHFIESIAEAAGDEEVSKRVSAVQATAEKLRAGEPVKGWPKLAELIGDWVVDKIIKWLGLSKAAEPVQSGGVGAPLVVIGINDFIARKFPQRELILEPWMSAQSLSMVYSWRGVGKTHVALGIAYALATGGKFLGWEAPKPRKVMYVDGEMPAPALQARLAAIVAASGRNPEPDMLRLITPDLQAGGMPDLATAEGQAAINSVIDGAELVILDNLSCLVRRGGRENEAESWLEVAEWALAHRAAGRSILFIHHAGKGGQQRGTSKREDLLDTVICLRRPLDYTPADGAAFEIHYEKARSLFGDATAPIEARLTADPRGAPLWVTRPLTDSTFERVVRRANDGLKQSEIAEELGVNRSTVSRIWRKAEAEGQIKKTKGQR